MSKITEAAKDERCVRCSTNDGTVVAAHINGPMAHRLGRGMGVKPDDLFAAHLCHRCHDVMDRRVGGATQEEMANGWPIYVLITIARLRNRGVI